MSADLPRPSLRWDAWAPETLAEHKRRRGTRVSLVLPARDEAATVGGIVRRLRDALVDRVRLVDEIVVVDSDSTDDTAAVARAAGATVHAAGDIRPELGARPGKGEAMWKSLFVTSGDLLVFMDADLTEWDTHFVTGLLGPLLTDDDVALVKGFYDRPLAPDRGLAPDSGLALDSGPAAGSRPAGGARPATEDERPSEGGRVTELVARPLLALHWPELAGVVQPLAGEWAVRRDLLEQLPVPTGYAVELAVLVDTLTVRGPAAIAQVDLGLRRHGHQRLRDLGVMALQIQAVVDARRTGRPSPEHLALRQFDWSSGAAVPVVRDVDLRERPPAVTVPGYAGVPSESPC